MGKADRLSRRLDWQKGVERDNEDQKLIKPEWIRRVEMLIKEENLRERIRKAQEGDGKIVEAIKGLKGAGRNKSTKGRRIESRGWNSTKGRKDIRAGRRPQERNNTTTPRHSIRGAWREMEDDRAD